MLNYRRNGGLVKQAKIYGISTPLEIIKITSDCKSLNGQSKRKQINNIKNI